MSVLDAVYAQILVIERDGYKPSEVRLGMQDYYEAARITSRPYMELVHETGEVRLFGVPVRRLPIQHAVSVV